MDNNTHEVWKRPENVPYPSVWSRFDGNPTIPIHGVIPKFWIQDIPKEEYDNIVEIMVTRFMLDEPISSCANIFDDEQSLQSMRKMWKEVLEQKVGICCYMENPDNSEKPILSGINCTYIASKGHTSSFTANIENVGKSAYSVLYTADYVLNQMKNPFEELKMDHLLGAMGLFVFREFRGQALGMKLIEAREPLCKAIGIPASITVFTSPISQKLAHRVGYKVLSEISYADIMKINPEVRFDDVEKKAKSAMCMYKVF